MISIIYTMKKRGIDPVKRIKYALDELAKSKDLVTGGNYRYL
jgi:hypothetical protein